MWVTRPRAVVATTAVLCTALACTDFEAPEAVVVPDVLVVDPSFARDIQPIFTARCATPSCHNLSTQQQGLNLEPGFAYAEIVDADPFSRGIPYIRPLRPDSSFLVRMIQPDPGPRFDLPRMPLGREPLTDSQIATIINWVNAGAPNN